MFDSTFWTLITIIVAGLVIFVLAILLDGLFNLGDFPAMHILGVLLAGGGAATLGIRGLGVVPLLFASIAGAIVGLIMVFILMRLLAAAKRSEHAGRIVDFGDLIGSKVSVIWWSESMGDVLVDVSGQRIKVPAESKTVIPKDTQLKIVDYSRVDDSLVKVFVEAVN